MVVFHSIHSDYHQKLVKTEKKRKEREKRKGTKGNSSKKTSSSTRLPALTPREKKKKRTYSASVSGSGGTMKTPRIVSSSRKEKTSTATTNSTKKAGKRKVKGKKKAAGASQRENEVPVFEVPSDMPIRLVPLNTPPPSTKKKKKKKKISSKAKDKEDYSLNSETYEQQQHLRGEGSEVDADVEHLLHQLKLEKRKCLVLSQIVEEQGAFLENIQREKLNESSAIDDTDAFQHQQSPRSRSHEAQPSSRRAGDREGKGEKEEALRRNVTDAITVLQLIEQEGEVTRGELTELRKMAKSFHEQISRSQASEAAALEALSQAESRAAAAEVKLRSYDNMAKRRQQRERDDISILSGLAGSPSAMPIPSENSFQNLQDT